MKKVVMVKRGFAVMVLIQDDKGYHLIVGKAENAVKTDLADAAALNNLYLDLKAKGYTVKPEEAEKQAPPKPEKKANKGPSWDFGEGGFDRQKYIETAKTIEGATYVDPRWGIKVRKAFREKVYEAMGAKRIR